MSTKGRRDSLLRSTPLHYSIAKPLCIASVGENEHEDVSVACTRMAWVYHVVSPASLRSQAIDSRSSCRYLTSLRTGDSAELGDLF